MKTFNRASDRDLFGCKHIVVWAECLLSLLTVFAPLQAHAGDSPPLGNGSPEGEYVYRPRPRDPNFLGRGCFGEVYRLPDGRCIKIFADRKTNLSDELYKLNTTARCGGPRVYGLGNYNGSTGLVMDTVPIGEAVASFPRGGGLKQICGLGTAAKQAVTDSLAEFVGQGFMPDDFQGYLFVKDGKYSFKPMDCFNSPVERVPAAVATDRANGFLQAMFGPDSPQIRPRPMRPTGPLRTLPPYRGAATGSAAIGAGLEFIKETGVATQEQLLVPLVVGGGTVAFATGGRPGVTSFGTGLAGAIAASAGASALGASPNQAELAGAYGSFAGGFCTGNPAAGVANGIGIVGSYAGSGVVGVCAGCYKYGAGNFLGTLADVFWREGLVPR